MIDFREVDPKRLTLKWYCEECELEIGGIVETEWSFHGPNCNRFFKKHKDCDKTQEREYDPGDLKLKFCQACYEEDSKMPFAEIKRRWKGIQDMKGLTIEETQG